MDSIWWIIIGFLLIGLSIVFFKVDSTKKRRTRQGSLRQHEPTQLPAPPTTQLPPPSISQRSSGQPNPTRIVFGGLTGSRLEPPRRRINSGSLSLPDTCPICHQKFEKPIKVMRCLSCNSLFHIKCFVQSDGKTPATTCFNPSCASTGLQEYQL